MQLTGIRPPSARLAHMWSTLSNTFWILVLAIIAMFAFFLALGAFNAGDVMGVTIAVIGLTIAWIIHAVWLSRHSDGRDPEIVHARERRGF